VWFLLFSLSVGWLGVLTGGLISVVVCEVVGGWGFAGMAVP